MGNLKIYPLIVYKYLIRNWAKVFPLLFILVLVIILEKRLQVFTMEPVVAIGLIGTYQNHDLPPEVTGLISQGLVEPDNSFRISPKLAEGWDVNKEATIFTFKLKANQLWSDNTPVKSKELSFDIPNVEITYPDEQTIQFKLKDSYSPFPSLLIRPVFKNRSLVGTGPYIVKKVEKSRIFITRIELKPLREGLPEVTLRFYPNERTAMTGFYLGEVQAILGLNDVQDLGGKEFIRILQVDDFSKIVTVLYHTKDTVLSNRSLRQALSYGAPKVEGYKEAINPYPSFSWVYGGEIKSYLSNERGAQEALERAKLSSSEELLQKEIVLTSTAHLERIGQKIVDSWKRIGINAVLRVESGIPQNFQALLITQSIPYDPDQYFLWHSTQEKTNLTKYSSARVDKDLEDGRKVVDEEERKTKYGDFQKVLLEDAPATFLYFPKYNVVYLKKVEKELNKILPLQIPHS